MRLQVFLSHSRLCSRRKALRLIQDGEVTVGGAVVREPSYDVSPQSDNVYLGTRKVELKANSYIILNKPRGFVTTLKDRHADTKVTDLLPSQYGHLYPVGRLDKESEGLLLFTNDGDLTFRLLHPRFKVNKVYLTEVGRRIRKEDILPLEKGIVIDGRPTYPAQVKIVYATTNKTVLRITLHEGRKRQIRLMFTKLGYNVRRLKRIQYGPIPLGSLKTGAWRALSGTEITLLRKACGLEDG